MLGGLGSDGLETLDGWEARRVGVGRRRRRRRRIASMPCQLVVGSWRMWFPVVSALALARAPTQRCGCSGGVV